MPIDSVFGAFFSMKYLFIFMYTYKILLQQSTCYIIIKKYIFQNLSVVIFRRHLPVIISAKAKEVEGFLRFTIYHIKNGGA